MKILVCGSRTLETSEHHARIAAALTKVVLSEEAAHDLTIIHGGARGADHAAGKWGDDHGALVDLHPADWKGQGKAAGFIRNAAMLAEEPDLVLAFVDKPLAQSKGTAHMVNLALAANIPVRIFRLTD